MINKVLTVGCSFTYGDELDKPSESAWPHILANSNNWQVNNLGKGGGSNDRNIRIVFEELHNKYDLIIVAWTFYDRFEIATGDISTHSINNNRFLVNERPEVKWVTGYFKYGYNKTYNFLKYLRQVILLQSYLKQQNQKYIFCNTFCMWSDLNPDYETYYTKYKYLFDQIDKKYFIDWPLGSMLQWQGDCPLGPNNHPLELGHQRIAERINEHIRHLGWVS